MIINKTNIKKLLGESSSTFDNSIDMLIPSLIDSIINYCNNDFIMKSNYNNTYVYDSVSMIFTSTTITVATSIPITTGDFIRIQGTCYNDGIYQVNAYHEGVITIESVKTMRVESIDKAYIAIMDLPSELIHVISDHIKANIINDNDIQREKIDDVEYTYFASNASIDITSNNATILNKYRKVYKECLFGGDY